MQCKSDPAGRGGVTLAPTIGVHEVRAVRAIGSNCEWAEGSVDVRAPVIGPGTIVGNYQVLAPLAQGGMGTVFVARHLALGRTVALKFLRRKLLRDPEAARRFCAEAVATARLSHPGVVSLFDVGNHQGSAYLVMELLPGESLNARLGRRELELAEVLDIGIQLAKTLAAAHAAGVVHRDIKPDNVHLVPDPSGSGFEYVKVLDFGVAKLTPVPGTRLSVDQGDGFGTPHYMAPEQCRGAREVDHRSDIYALGCLLFRLLSGVVPFDGTVVDVLLAHQQQPAPSLRKLAPTVPGALERLIARMLHKRPADRPQNMAEVARELRAMADSLRLYHPPLRPQSGRWRRAGAWAWLFAIGLLALCAVAAVAG